MGACPVLETPPSPRASGTNLPLNFIAQIDLPERQRLVAKESHQQQEAGAEQQRVLAMLEEFVTNVSQRAMDKPRWTPMPGRDVGTFEQYYERAKSEFSRSAGGRVPFSILAFKTESLLTLVSADDETYGLLPDELKTHIDEEYRLPGSMWHQMFGMGFAIQGDAFCQFQGYHMLLQFVSDDMMRWQFSDTGTFQFWISPKNLKERNWDGVHVTFEGH